MFYECNRCKKTVESLCDLEGRPHKCGGSWVEYIVLVPDDDETETVKAYYDYEDYDKGK